MESRDALYEHLGHLRVLLANRQAEVETEAAASPPAQPPAPADLGAPVATPVAKPVRPIQESPERAYVRDQINLLAKTNPSTVAQLIQTWMDEDRRN